MIDTRSLAVAVCGSPRSSANSTLLARAVLGELSDLGCRCETIRLAEHLLLPCLAHDTCAAFDACPRKDDAGEILDRVYPADVLVLATPVYYENVSGQLKLFMDRNVFRYAHEQWLPARAVGLIAVTAETGLSETLDAMARYVALSTQDVPPMARLGVLADEAGEVAGDEAAMERARGMGRELAGYLGLSPA